MTKNKKVILSSIILVGVIGFFDSLYLTLKHYTQTSILCSILEGCDRVTTSTYSIIGGVPVALLGALYYLAIFILAIANIVKPDKKLAQILFYLSLVGFLFSLWLVYLQIFVIKALCLYCLISALTSTLILALSFIYLIKLKGDQSAASDATDK